MRATRRTKSGFTLIELMIAVAIIGILAATAVTSFRLYQWRTRRSEAYGNLSAIKSLEKSYISEFNVYVGSAGAWPGGGFDKRPWTPAAQNAFAVLGFAPEGNVFYDYSVNVGCPAAQCFTAAAYGDADANGLVSAIVYVEPDPTGATVNDLIGFGLPVEPGTGRVMIQEVAANLAADLY